VWRKFEVKIAGGRNYSNKWVVWAESVCNSNIKDLAKTDQNVHAMMLLNKSTPKLLDLGNHHKHPLLNLYILYLKMQRKVTKKYLV